MSGPRFSIVPAAAITDTRLDGWGVRVLCLLGRHTNDNGWCHRSQAKMAVELGCSRPLVNRALKDLAACGYVETKPHESLPILHYRVRLDLSAEELAAAKTKGVTPQDTVCQPADTPPEGSQPADIPVSPLTGVSPVLTGGVTLCDTERAHKERSSTSLRSVEQGARPAKKLEARKRLATDATLPAVMTPAMETYAAESGFMNGSGDRLFGAWRDHHISRATPIADPEASFRTWVRNEIKFNPRSNGHGQQPSQPAKLYGVSAANAEFRARSNRGAVAALRELGAVGDDGLWSAANGDRDEGS